MQRPFPTGRDRERAVLERLHREAVEARAAEDRRLEAAVAAELARCVALGLGWREIRPRLACLTNGDLLDKRPAGAGKV